MGTKSPDPNALVAPRPSTAGNGRGLAVGLILAAALAGVLAAQLSLSRTLNANWDEHGYLARVHAYVRGEPLGRLQTFHVHVFAPLLLAADSPRVAGEGAPEIVELLRLRAVSWLFLVLTAGGLVVIGRQLFGSVPAGLASALAATSFSLVLAHGTAARYDPLLVCAFVVASALWLRASGIASGRTGSVLALAACGGALFAVSALVSVKAALYLPTLAVMFGATWVAGAGQDRRRAGLSVAAFVAGAVIVGGAAFAAHDASLPPVGPASTGGGRVVGGNAQRIAEAAAVMFSRVGVQQPKYLTQSLRDDLTFWSLVAMGAAVLGAELVRRGPRGAEERVRAVQALALALPLLSLFVYRNSYPYFYVCIVPPAALLVGACVARVERALASLPGAAAVVAVAAVCAPGVMGAASFVSSNGSDQLATQRAVIDAVHEVFPTPMPYIDRCGMIASYPRVGPFMSTATMQAYRATGKPIWSELLAREQPAFVVENVSSLRFERRSGGRRQYRWLDEDRRVLRESFVPHWGRIWVAGHVLGAELEEKTFQEHIGGVYLVEADGPVVIDGVERDNGSRVELARGAHTVRAAEPRVVMLRTARAGKPPDATPSDERLFLGLSYRGTPALDALPDEPDDDDGPAPAGDEPPAEPPADGGAR